MYNQQDQLEIDRQFKIFWIVYISVLVLLAAALIFLCVIRLAWPGFILAPIAFFAGIAGWDLWGSRLLAYRKYVDLEKDYIPVENVGRVMEISEEVKTFHGVRFYRVEFRQDAEDGEDPIDSYLYYDISKGEVPFVPGDIIRVKSIERCIRHWEYVE